MGVVRFSGVAILAVFVAAAPAWAGAEESSRQKLKDRFQRKNIWMNVWTQSDETGSGYKTRDEDSRSVADQAVMATPQEAAANYQAGGQIAAGMARSVAAALRPAPEPFAIYQTDYEAEIEEDIAFITQHVELEIFNKTGSTNVPLVSADVGLKEVTLNQKPSVISRIGRKYYLVVSKPGRYHLNMEYFVRVARERERGPGQFSFEVLPSPISILDVQIHEPDMDLFVDPSIKLEKETAHGSTLATAVLPYTEVVTVRWNKAINKVDIPTVALEPKVYVDVLTLTSIGEGIAHSVTTLRYSILQSEISELRAVVPDGVAVVDVQGGDVRDWKSLAKDGKQILTVYLNRSVKGAYALRVISEKPIGEGSVTTQLPEFVVLGVERQHGLTGVQARTNVEIAFGKLENATPIDVKELPQELWNQAAFPVLLAYKYLNPPVTAQIEVVKHDEIPVLVAAIDSASYVTLLTEEGKVLTQVTFQMRNNVKQFVRLDLPSGATFLSCFVSGKPVKPAQDKAGRVLIPLEKSETLGETVAKFPVEIMYLTASEKLHTVGRVSMHLPHIDIPTSQVYWTVYVPEEYDYWWFRGDAKRTTTSAPTALEGLARRSQVMNKLASQYEAYSGARDAPQASEAIQQVRAKGALPIRMEMPTAGRIFRFRKLLVTDESPWLAFSYSRNLSEARQPLSWAVVGLLFVGLVGWGRRQSAGRIQLSAMEKGLTVVGGCVVLLVSWLARVPLSMLLLAVVCAGGYLAFSRWLVRSRRTTPQ